MTLTRTASGAAIFFATLLALSALMVVGNQRHAKAEGTPEGPSGAELVDQILDVSNPEEPPVDGSEVADHVICDIDDPTLEANGVPNFDCDGGNGGGPVDVCPNDAGVQTETPCPSDNDDGDGTTPPADTSSGGGGGGGGGGSSKKTDGEVLGAASDTAISCDLYLTEFIRFGGENNPEQVTRLQSFLNTFEGTALLESGVYDEATLAAVHAFQQKYAAEILTPWGATHSTGFVYLTTRKKVNEIRCERLFPLTEAELQEIANYRAGTNPIPAALEDVPSFIPDITLPEEPQPAAVAEAGVEASSDEESPRGFWQSVRGFFGRIFGR